MKPVIVGIDGSQAAIAAVLWSVDEAVGRGVPLHLVAVIKQGHPSADDYARDPHTPRLRSKKRNSRSKPARSPWRSRRISNEGRQHRFWWRRHAMPR